MWSLVTVMRNCGIQLFYETVKHAIYNLRGGHAHTYQPSQTKAISRYQVCTWFKNDFMYTVYFKALLFTMNQNLTSYTI